MTKADLHAFGEAMFGPRYQTQLAMALTQVRGSPVSQTQVSQWVAGPDGQRDPPNWLDSLLLRVAIQAKHDLMARAETLDLLVKQHVSEPMAVTQATRTPRRRGHVP